MKLFRILLLAFLPIIAHADWAPAKPITVLIGFKPGSGNEQTFRAISAIVQKNNPSANFIIELKPGADSVLASNALVEAKPDGYTISIPSYMGTFVTNDIWQKDIKKFQYDSFSNVLGIGKSPLVFVANAQSKISTVSELAKLVRNPDRPITFAGGAGAHRMAYEYFMLKAGGKRDQLRYAVHQGPLQAVLSVAGDTGMEFGVMPITVALPLIQAGKVKVIGITGSRKLQQLPAAEPIKIGGSFINIYAAWAIALPPATPKEIVDWYQTVFSKAMQSEEARKYYYDNLIFVDEAELTPKGLSRGIEELRATWIPLSQQINLDE